MEEKVLLARIAELTEALSALPKAQGQSHSSGAYIPQQPAARSVDDLLDHLRLQIKYLLFDLEATRRENRYLRQMLERRSGLGEGGEST